MSRFFLLGDKAYSEDRWKESLSQQGLHLLTPVKLRPGNPPRLPGGDAFDTSVSRACQPIESFFNLKQIIAHHLKTICAAEQIFVLDGGELAECGNHDTLSSLWVV